MAATNGWVGRAFGLTIESARPIPGIAAEDERLPRRVRWTEADLSDVETRWRPSAEEVLVDLRHPDGRLFMSVAHDPALGFRAEAPGYGVHVIDRRGSTITSSVPHDGTRRWQRLFFAQVLPLAAAATGLDVFHAGAVALDGRAFAFVAPSGTGKTSVVTHLVGGGAGFLTDDVLALEPVDGEVVAHAGAGALSIDPAELESLDADAQGRVAGETWDTGDGKLQVDVPATAPAEMPLGAVFFLHRSTGTTVSIRRGVKGVGPRLLGSAFLPYVKSQERNATHLDVSAAIAGAVPTYAVGIPAASEARATAGRIHAFGAEEGLWG